MYFYLQPWSQMLEKIAPSPPVQCWGKNLCPLIAFVSPTLNRGAGEICKTKRPRLQPWSQMLEKIAPSPQFNVGLKICVH